MGIRYEGKLLSYEQRGVDGCPNSQASSPTTRTSVWMLKVLVTSLIASSLAATGTSLLELLCAASLSVASRAAGGAASTSREAATLLLLSTLARTPGRR